MLAIEFTPCICVDPSREGLWNILANTSDLGYASQRCIPFVIGINMFGISQSHMPFFFNFLIFFRLKRWQTHCNF